MQARIPTRHTWWLLGFVAVLAVVASAPASSARPQDCTIIDDGQGSYICHGTGDDGFCVHAGNDHTDWSHCTRDAWNAVFRSHDLPELSEVPGEGRGADHDCEDGRHTVTVQTAVLESATGQEVFYAEYTADDSQDTQDVWGCGEVDLSAGRPLFDDATAAVDIAEETVDSVRDDPCVGEGEVSLLGVTVLSADDEGNDDDGVPCADVPAADGDDGQDPLVSADDRPVTHHDGQRAEMPRVDRTEDDDTDPATFDIEDLGAVPVLGANPTLETWFAAVAATAGLAALLLAAVRLYRRLDREDVVQHDLRSKIREIVHDEPGIHAAELARRLDVAAKTVHYHARILAEYDILAIEERGRRTVLFDVHAHDRDRRDVEAAVGTGTRRDLVELLVDEPGLSLAEAARRLDRHRSTVKHHADALVDDGVLTARVEGRCKVLSLAEEAAQVLDG